MSLLLCVVFPLCGDSAPACQACAEASGSWELVFYLQQMKRMKYRSQLSMTWFLCDAVKAVLTVVIRLT